MPSGLASYSFLAPSWPAFSEPEGYRVQTMVSAVDAVVMGVPLLGATFVSAALKGVDIDDASLALFTSLSASTDAGRMTKKAAVSALLSAVYAEFKAAPAGNASVSESSAVFGAARRRRLAQTDAELKVIIDHIAAAIADSNDQIRSSVLLEAVAAVANKTALSADVFTRLQQYTSLQATAIADAIRRAGAALAAGNVTAAIQAAAAVEAAYTGDALRAAATNVTTTPISVPSGSGNDDDDDKRRVALGAGIGIGLGVPIVLAILAVGFWQFRKRRYQQTTMPAPVAEGVYSPQRFALRAAAASTMLEDEESDSEAGGRAVTDEAAQEARIAEYYRSRMVTPAAAYPSPASHAVRVETRVVGPVRGVSRAAVVAAPEEAFSV